MQRPLLCAALRLAATLDASAVVVTGVTAPGGYPCLGNVSQIVDGADAAGLSAVMFTAAVVSEPSAFALFGLGLFGLAKRLHRNADVTHANRALTF
jgi:hypothetical protein